MSMDVQHFEPVYLELEPARITDHGQRWLEQRYDENERFNATLTDIASVAIVEHWKTQGQPVYDPNILKPRAEDGEGMPDEDDAPDELYDQAVASLGDMRFISISLLQRKLRVGYNRAARMIERMERDGIVGPADGAKPREVLVRPLGELPGAGA